VHAREKSLKKEEEMEAGNQNLALWSEVRVVVHVAIGEKEESTSTCMMPISGIRLHLRAEGVQLLHSDVQRHQQVNAGV
jgi:hypothetical protein